jgi:hypothetical protein
MATVNVPGYLPMDDDPPVFDTPREAWDYLADERERGEDNADDADHFDIVATVTAMAMIDGPGVVVGPTPGYDGDHDLGLAYCVTAVS